MRFSTVVWRNIFRRRMRSALTISGVAVAVGAVVALVGIARGFEHSALEIYKKRDIDLVVFRSGSVQWLNSVLQEDLVDRIEEVPGVAQVSPVLAEAISMDEAGMFGVLIRGLLARSFLFRDLDVISGRTLEADDRQVVMLGAALAAGLDKKVGDDLEIHEEGPYRVIGIFETPNLFENATMIMPLDDLQELMARQGEITMVNVVAERNDRASLDALQERIAGLTTGLEVRPIREFVETAVEIRLARSAAWLTSTIALVVGTIGMINTMLTAVFERTRELALLRAIGWRKATVIRMIMWESVLLGLAGALFGTLGAIGVTQLLSLLPASGQLVTGDISVSVVLQGFAIAVVLGVAGGLYPAYRASRLEPTEGLRHE